jgi:superfamily I DNA/RNA helicase/RecB family exonuclease
MSPTYRLDRTPRPLAEPPDLDDAQRAVAQHESGPLLVLAGPGTGKTTTLVEAAVDRVERRGLDPDEVLVLTFSRKAADELRNRITARLGRTSSTPMSSTFHSFCYALLRRWQPAELYSAPLRLLSAPEQDVRLRDLLRHSRDTARARWPKALDQALSTRGFAREVHAVLSRARELGLEPGDLTRVGVEADRAEWVAAGAFMEEYLTVLDFEGAIDYSELVHRAVLLAESPEVGAALRERFKAVLVDEYQDTDPSQVRLLQALAGGGRDLTVVGDPDQSIYAFRGAVVRGILDFPTDFPRADGAPADVVALTTTRRFGTRLLTASRRVAAGIGVKGSIDRETFETFRNPRVESGSHGDGRVEVVTFTSSGAETDHIADLLRRAHLEDGVPWSQMAVLVRSGLSSIPGLRRALVAGGVPVEVAGDEVPLAAEPAVQPLLAALRAAVEPSALTAETAHMLLLSPLVELDAAALRRLGRLLRQRDRDEGRAPRSSAELLRASLAEPGFLAGVDDLLARRPATMSRLLHSTSEQLAAGAPAEEALWSLWSGTTWPRRLRRQVDRGGAPARAAHRDLDAVCALFEVAARAEEHQDHTGALVFLEEVEAQQIPADTLAERGVRGEAVRLLTAHRSKGLEWRLVVVAGVQEGSWPDVRRRGTLLQADRLGRYGLAEPPGPAAMLAEERRLFYVAVTRARERLVVTAVASPEADGPQPSRLIDDLGLPVVLRPGRPRRLLSLSGVVAELRRVAADEAASPALRRAAAARLAALADETVGGRSIAPSADPASWWGLRRRTDNAVPVRPADAPLRISASALGAILDCPMRWFLSREAAGESTRSSSLGFGSVIHALAEYVSTAESVQAGDLYALLDSVWGRLDFESPWIADRERAEAEKVIDRFLRWHAGRADRAFVASEVPFSVEVDVGGGERAALSGRLDRVERDGEGRVVVVDFKTSRNAPAETSLGTNPQLGLYQLAVESGGLDDVCGGGARSGGAELVQLRVDVAGSPKVQVQAPQVPDDDGYKPVEIQLASAAQVMRSERFVATANDHCRMCDFASLCPARRRSGTVL